MQKVRDLNVFPCNPSNMEQELRHTKTSQENNFGTCSTINNRAKHTQQNPMKKLVIPLLMISLAMTLLTGCAWQVGGDKKVTTMEPTTGQQLIDLQKAKDSGAITDSEYQAQKAKLLGNK